jgi:hypothetical protein
VSTFMRTVRPFVGLDALQRIVDSTLTLQVGTDTLQPDSMSTLTHEGFLLREVVLQLGETDEAYAELGAALVQKCAELEYDPAAVELVVVASSPYLKIAELLVRRKVAEFADTERRIVLHGPPRPRALRSPRSGCTIDVYLLLGSSAQPRPLRPWRKGTWLAQVSFTISSDLAPIGFTPRPLTAQVRKDNELPDDTVRFVVFDGDESPLDPNTSETALLMYVDPDVLAKMAIASSKPASQLFQLQLFLDAVRAIVERCHEDEKLKSTSLDELGETLLGRLVEGVSKRPGVSTEQRRIDMENTLELLKSKPMSFIGRVEATIGYRKMLNEVLDQ